MTPDTADPTIQAVRPSIAEAKGDLVRALVGVLGALATAANGTGVLLLLLGAAMLYLYGPREDRGHVSWAESDVEPPDSSLRTRRAHTARRRDPARGRLVRAGAGGGAALA
ncbi:MAG TPA: hypothetical protein VIJ66_00430 [Solirubrobacteraceae bacterium]